MCEASDRSARVEFDHVPLLEPAALEAYRAQGCVPGGTERNWASYGHKVAPLDERRRQILCDPQTSGGLLAAVDPRRVEEFLRIVRGHGLELASFGEIVPRAERLIEVV
jgi:selenide,water dikinase